MRASAQVLTAWVTRVFLTLGLTPRSARIAALALVWADLQGIESHGVFLLPAYARRLRLGVANPLPRMKVRQHDAVGALLDGDNGLGPVVAVRAMDLAMRLARRVGVGAVVVRRSGHFAAAGYYAQWAARKGYVGIAMSNGASVMAPYGARAPFFGTNPIAVGIPVEGSEPILADMATSAVARGKIILAQREGRKIPSDWAIDPEGNPTTDPTAALAGALLPVGGPKGYGLALAIEALTGALADGAIGPQVRPLHEDVGGPQGTCHFFLALDPGAFALPGVFQHRMAETVAGIRSLPPAVETSSILLPGEPGQRAERERRLLGVLLSLETTASLRELGKQVGIPLPGARKLAVGINRRA